MALLVLLLALPLAAPVKQPPAFQPFAFTGIALHKKPTRSSPEVGRVPALAAVEILDQAKTVLETVAEPAAAWAPTRGDPYLAWVRVRAGGQGGWASLDGVARPLPGPGVEVAGPAGKVRVVFGVAGVRDGGLACVLLVSISALGKVTSAITTDGETKPCDGPPVMEPGRLQARDLNGDGVPEVVVSSRYLPPRGGRYEQVGLFTVEGEALKLQAKVGIGLPPSGTDPVCQDSGEAGIVVGKGAIVATTVAVPTGCGTSPDDRGKGPPTDCWGEKIPADELCLSATREVIAWDPAQKVFARKEEAATPAPARLRKAVVLEGRSQPKGTPVEALRVELRESGAWRVRVRIPGGRPGWAPLSALDLEPKALADSLGRESLESTEDFPRVVFEPE